MSITPEDLIRERDMNNALAAKFESLMIEARDERDDFRARLDDVLALLDTSECKAAAMREALEEYDRKLNEAWGKYDDPHAIAYGWTKLKRDAALGFNAGREYVHIDTAAQLVEDTDIESHGGWDHADDGPTTLRNAAARVRALRKSDSGT